jgi:hypothetical protein
MVKRGKSGRTSLETMSPSLPLLHQARTRSTAGTTQAVVFAKRARVRQAKARA